MVDPLVVVGTVCASHGTEIDGRVVSVAVAHEPKSRYGGTAGGPPGRGQGQP